MKSLPTPTRKYPFRDFYVQRSQSPPVVLTDSIPGNFTREEELCISPLRWLVRTTCRPGLLSCDSS
ncbi:hypothetical protein E2C01_050089 [Portunus trituberculatus]|uniref:Uncharacterized protein n=1 Tax=Portunus trituberculatus TaxID=210409 RepID=A0A5B7GEY4_PORTR|nr:hypothetical protein [Portunus trituberculatus]